MSNQNPIKNTSFVLFILKNKIFALPLKQISAKQMRIITHTTIKQYSELHTDAKSALDEWYINTEQSRWSCFADVKQTFNSMDSVGIMKLIANESEYEAIMARVDELVEIVDDNTSQTDKNYIELDFLTDLVVAYEKEHYPIGKPSISDILKTRMHEMDLNQKTLAEMLGISASRVSEYLTGKSEPTLQIARKMQQKLNIDANVILASV
jgi:HTH-type transcriptional regulator/antitoxin HigA